MAQTRCRTGSCYMYYVRINTHKEIPVTAIRQSISMKENQTRVYKPQHTNKTKKLKETQRLLLAPDVMNDAWNWQFIFITTIVDNIGQTFTAKWNLKDIVSSVSKCRWYCCVFSIAIEEGSISWDWKVPEVHFRAFQFFCKGPVRHIWRYICAKHSAHISWNVAECLCCSPFIKVYVTFIYTLPFIVLQNWKKKDLTLHEWSYLLQSIKCASVRSINTYEIPTHVRYCL